MLKLSGTRNNLMKRESKKPSKAKDYTRKRVKKNTTEQKSVKQKTNIK